MELRATSIPDVKILVPRKFGDARGFFSEVYSRRALTEVTGIPVRGVTLYALALGTGTTRRD